MGLEGTGGAGGGDEGSLLAAPGLAQKLEDEATNGQNANILNLFLGNVSLPGGAPAPITNNVGSIDVTATSIVFNKNLTRERYGRAAVNDNITLESDRRSLLLDGNQTNTQKAQSILGGLEFDNGLSAVQSMSSGDVTGTNTPSDIDSFNRRPDSMYQNTARLNVTKREHLATAFTDSAEPEYVEAMVSQAGGNLGPTTFSAVVSDQTLMDQIASDRVASIMLSMHPNGVPEMVGSQTAMQELSDSSAAMDEIASSAASMEAVVNSGVARTEVTANSTARTQIISSSTAMNKVANSQAFMSDIASDSTFMSEVANSSTAMEQIADSQTAINEIGAPSNENVAANTVLNSSTATNKLQRSSIDRNFSYNFNQSSNVRNQGSTTRSAVKDRRVLVTNNTVVNGGQDVNARVTNAAGPEFQSGTTFIANDVDVNVGRRRGSGNVSYNVIFIE